MKPLKYALKEEWFNIILLIIPFIVIPFVWAHLPEQLPTHWNLKGEVDDYSSKAFALFSIPIVSIGVYLLLLYLPKIDPKKRITIGQKPIPVIRTLIILLFLGMYSWMIAVWLGINLGLHSTNWLFVGLAVFFIVLGNYMRTIQPNYFVGIRVPWTLESEDNWRQTHKFASYLWVAGGILLIILFPFLGTRVYQIFFIAIIIAISLIPAGYSFYIYKTKS